jgi:hypothetical protein
VSVPLPKACQVKTALSGAVNVRALPFAVTVTPAVVCKFVDATLGVANTLATENTNTVNKAITFVHSELFSVLLVYFIYILLLFLIFASYDDEPITIIKKG